MMIKERTIPGGKKGKPTDTEYYLLVVTNNGESIIYNDWYSTAKLAELPGCTINKACLLDRIRSTNPLFKTLEDCTFRKKITNSNKEAMRISHKPRITKLNNKSFLEEDIFQTLQTLWHAGSLHKEYRIMGSR